MEQVNSVIDILKNLEGIEQGWCDLENNIYKGFLYSNVDNGTNYDTEFNTVSTFAVLDSEIVESQFVEEMNICYY